MGVRVAVMAVLPAFRSISYTPAGTHAAVRNGAIGGAGAARGSAGAREDGKNYTHATPRNAAADEREDE